MRKDIEGLGGQQNWGTQCETFKDSTKKIKKKRFSHFSDHKGFSYFFFQGSFRLISTFDSRKEALSQRGELVSQSSVPVPL